MSDTNPTRVRYAQNKAAFDDIIGDPFTVPDPVEGAYYRLKRSGGIKATQFTGLGQGTTNLAKPNIMDFFCDVELTVELVIKNDTLLARFWKTYLDDELLLGQAERASLEQRIGKKLRAFRISPASRYFVSIRKARTTTN